MWLPRPSTLKGSARGKRRRPPLALRSRVKGAPRETAPRECIWEECGRWGVLKTVAAAGGLACVRKEAMLESAESRSAGRRRAGTWTA